MGSHQDKTFRLGSFQATHHLDDMLGICSLLGVAMHGDVHPCFFSRVGPTTEAISHSVVLSGDIHYAQVKLALGLMPRARRLPGPRGCQRAPCANSGSIVLRCTRQWVANQYAQTTCAKRSLWYMSPFPLQSKFGAAPPPKPYSKRPLGRGNHPLGPAPGLLPQHSGMHRCGGQIVRLD